MYEAMHLARCLATRKAPVRREYPALNDTVVGTCIDPNKFSEVNSEHNLEESWILEWFYMLGYLGFHKGQQHLLVLLGFRGNFWFPDTVVM